MTAKTPDKVSDALRALKTMQEESKRKGLDKLTMDQIDAEIAAYRRERRLKQSRPNKAAL